MTEEKLYQIISALENIERKEWEGLKKYVDYKMGTIGKIKNNQLAINTIKTFFIKSDSFNQDLV